MTEHNVTTCDTCWARITRFGLIVKPFHANTTDAEGATDITFFDGSWNGGHYCTVECAKKALDKITDPAPDPVMTP